MYIKLVKIVWYDYPRGFFMGCEVMVQPSGFFPCVDHAGDFFPFENLGRIFYMFGVYQDEFLGFVYYLEEIC